MSNPTITKLNKQDNKKLTFTIENVDVSIINAIRRTILKDIEVFVLDTSEDSCIIEKNTSRLTNEIIKQRLDCIPVHINDMEFPHDQYVITLKKQNADNHIIYVTSEDFKIVSKLTSKEISTSEKEKIFPKCEKTGMFIDILRLRPKISNDLEGEKIEMTCNLKKTSASENSSYNVVTKVAFSNTIDINKSKEAWNKHKQTLLDNIEDEEKNWNIFNAQRYFIENSFDFIVESIGIYKANDLLILACKYLINNLKQFSENLKNEEVEINSNESHFRNGVDVIITQNEITLGYMLQYILIKNNFNKEVNYVGFNKEHPHNNYGILRVQLNDNDITKVTSLLIDGIQILTEQLLSIQNSF